MIGLRGFVIATEISLKILKFVMGQFQNVNICLLDLGFIYVSLVIRAFLPGQSGYSFNKTS